MSKVAKGVVRVKITRLRMADLHVGYSIMQAISFV